MHNCIIVFLNLSSTPPPPQKNIKTPFSDKFNLFSNPSLRLVNLAVFSHLLWIFHLLPRVARPVLFDSSRACGSQVNNTTRTSASAFPGCYDVTIFPFMNACFFCCQTARFPHFLKWFGSTVLGRFLAIGLSSSDQSCKIIPAILTSPISNKPANLRLHQPVVAISGLFG